jgi:hypothetical protein
MNIQYAKNLRWLNPNQTLIEGVVKFDMLPNEVPFTASKNDPSLIGELFFNNAMLGYYGLIASYTSAPAPSTTSNMCAIAIQEYLDSKAQQYGYDNIISAVSYSDDMNPTFKAQGLAFKAWRSAVWAYFIQVNTNVASGFCQQPSVTELLNNLPQLMLY